MLSQTSVHVIRALTFLAAQPADKFVGAAAIAAATGAPQNYLGKLLQQFCQKGLLESQRGAGGGVRLAKPADSITLLQVVEPVEHLSQRRNCFMGQLCCGVRPCTYHKSWLKLHSDFVEFLESVTLAGILAQSEWQLPDIKSEKSGRKKK
ncbi:MAG: Rrf2 family transcriptional regulator [Candidatus Riflebacteria bacterium]|nr:Rrf2 family transcriptional regulator [Candidatus Riflebacteria bacterium]